MSRQIEQTQIEQVEQHFGGRNVLNWATSPTLTTLGMPRTAVQMWSATQARSTQRTA